MEGPPRDPLEIFPKEVWEMIILKVKDSEELRSFMKASKQLNDIFMDIHHLWLLDKVLPILTTTSTFKEKRYLGGQDVKNLRLVDKRWCGAVDSFLQNQPNLRPYKKDDDKLNSEKHIWSGRSYQHENEYLDSTTIGRNILINEENELSRFGVYFEALEYFGKSDRNPFPARSVVRFRQPGELPTIWGELDQDASQNLNNHVWFLTMAMAWGDAANGLLCNSVKCEPDLVWEWIVHSLTSLPNLKSLRLETLHHQLVLIDYMESSEAKKFLQLEKSQLPPLPSLESLTIIDFHTYPKEFCQKLVSKYSLQLRRLQISTFSWETREEWAFPNLTELILDDIKTIVKIKQILTSLEAPQLVKLRLTTKSYRNPITLTMEEDIFPWMALFPSLLFLDISCCGFSISERGTLKPPQDTNPFLKYLKIHNSDGVNYNFLRCLPSLQRLQVCVDGNEKPIVWDCSAFPEVNVKLEIETNSIYQSNVWDLCPKLRSFSMHRKFFKIYYKEFDRATYEKLKDNPELSERVKLRGDIRGFLKLSSDSDSEDDWVWWDTNQDRETEEEEENHDDNRIPIPVEVLQTLLGELLNAGYLDSETEEELEAEEDDMQDVCGSWSSENHLMETLKRSGKLRRMMGKQRIGKLKRMTKMKNCPF